MEDALYGYNIEHAIEGEEEELYVILAEVLVRKTGHISAVTMDKRKLVMSINYAVQCNNAIVLLHNGEPVGCMLLQIIKNVYTIKHSNIYKEHKSTIGSLMLLSHVLNCVFKDKDVFIGTVTPEFSNMVESVAGAYKIRDNVAGDTTRLLQTRK